MVSKKYPFHIDLAKNQLQNAVVQPLASAPSSPSNGQIYYDTVLGQFGVYQNGTWVYLAAGGTDTEAVQDVVAALLTPGSVITATYNDGANTLTLGIGTSQVTNAMLATGISADKIIDGSTNAYYTLAERTKLSGIATGATNYTDTNARANRLDQFAAPTASVSFNSQKITSLADPTNPQDAATKNYVDLARQGLEFKDSVAVASVANLTLSGEQTIDGVTTSASRILVKNQTTASGNGIYVTASGSWTRATDMDASSEAQTGQFVYVDAGTTQGGTAWVLSTTGAITLGTTSIAFSQFAGATSTTAGAGLTASGNIFAVGAGTGITVAADSVAVDTSVVSRHFQQTIGDGSTTSFALTHSLGTKDIIVMLRDTGTDEILDAYAVATSTSVATLTFNTAPTTNQYRVTIIG